jgi:hypothetical protein
MRMSSRDDMRVIRGVPSGPAAEVNDAIAICIASRHAVQSRETCRAVLRGWKVESKREGQQHVTGGRRRC